jgi:hypothetical protein
MEQSGRKTDEKKGVKSVFMVSRLTTHRALDCFLAATLDRSDGGLSVGAFW